MKNRHRLALLASVLLVTAGVARADELVDRAHALISGGKAKAAYELLLPVESERAGDPDYDFALGLAALESGKATEAAFAFERVLSLRPNDKRARAEMARAQFLLGERAAAKQEFESLRKEGVPDPVAVNIQRFLDAIEQLDRAAGTQWRAFVEVTGGYDSNVNSATTNGQVAVPALGGLVVTLGPGGTELDDAFLSYSAGLNVRHAYSPGVAIFAGGSFSQRINSSQDPFDTGSYDLNAGASFTQGKNTFTGGLQFSNLQVDHHEFRDAFGLVAQWQHTLNRDTQVTVYGQATQLDYKGANNIRDSHQLTAGVGLVHAYGGRFAPVVFGGAYVGKEDVDATGVPQLGNEFWGLRLGAQWTYSDRINAFVSGSYESKAYDAPEPAFLIVREDDLYDFRVGVNYVPAKNWRVTPQFSYTRNDSRIVLNDFTREVWSIAVRRDFR